MKRAFSFVISMFLTLSMLGQSDTLSKKFLNEGLVIDINKYNWLNNTVPIKDKSTEINTTAYILIAGKEKNISLAFGANITAINIYSDFYITKDTNENIIFTKYNDSISYSKNKIGVSYIGIPLEIRIKTNNNIKRKNFKFTIGTEIGYVLSSYHKYKGENYLYESTDKNIKFKIYNIYKVNKYAGSFYLKFFYDKIGVNFKYYVTPFFDKDDKVDPINAFSFGISFILF